jgi:hypothetical protein
MSHLTYQSLETVIIFTRISSEEALEKIGASVISENLLNHQELSTWMIQEH